MHIYQTNLGFRSRVLGMKTANTGINGKYVSFSFENSTTFRIKHIFCGIAIIAFTLMTFTSCSSDKKTENKKQEEVKEIYECPVKCGGQKFDKAGKCPDCGIVLEKISES